MLRANDQAKLVKAQERFAELERLLADEQTMSDQSQYGKLAKEFADLTSLMDIYKSYQRAATQIKELQESETDPS